MQFLLTHAFSIAPRPSHRTYFTTVELANGDKVVIPSVYRVPLLFVGAFLWGSVKLVLQADEATGLKREWEEFRVGIVHVARVAEAFLEAAKTQGDVDAGEDELKSKETKGMARMWRCEMFDRVLVRYKLGWLISEPDQLKEFWENYGDEEYAKDPVKTGQCLNALFYPYLIRFVADWKRITTKGVKGFKLTEDQIDDGLTIRQYVDGLKEVDGEWVWDEAGKHTSFRRANSFVESWRKTQVWGKDVRWTTVLAPLKQTAEDDNDVEMAEPTLQISALKAAPKALPPSAPPAMIAPAPAFKTTALPTAPKPTTASTAPIPKPSTPAPNDVAGLFRLKKEQREISISQTPFPLPPPSKPASAGKQPTHASKPAAPAPKQPTTAAKQGSSSISAAASTSTQAQSQPVGYVYPTVATNGSAPKYTSSFSWAPASSTFKPTPYTRNNISHTATPSITVPATTYHQSSISTAQPQRQLSSSSSVASPSISSAALIPFASSFSSINPSVPSVVHALTTQDRRVAALETEVAELKRKLLVREGKRRAVRWDDDDDDEPPAKRLKVTVEPGFGWWQNTIGHLATQEDVQMQDVSVKKAAKVDMKEDRREDKTVEDAGAKEKEVASVKGDGIIKDGGAMQEAGIVKEDGELSPLPEVVVNGLNAGHEKGKGKEIGQENGVVATEKEHADSPLSIRESSIASSVAPPSSGGLYPPPETPSSVASTPQALTVPLPNPDGAIPAPIMNGGGTQDDPMEVDDDDDDSPPPGLGTFGPIKSMRKSMTMGKAGS